MGYIYALYCILIHEGTTTLIKDHHHTACTCTESSRGKRHHDKPQLGHLDHCNGPAVADTVGDDPALYYYIIIYMLEP